MVDHPNPSGSDLFVKTLTIAANIGVGISILAETDSALLKAMAIGLVLVGIANFASLGHSRRALAFLKSMRTALAELTSIDVALAWVKSRGYEVHAETQEIQLELVQFTGEKRHSYGLTSLSRIRTTLSWLKSRHPMTYAEIQDTRLELVVHTKQQRRVYSIDRLSTLESVVAGLQSATAIEAPIVDLSGHAAVFYTALLVGFGGLVACAFGFAHSVYAVTLSGSLVASLAFVTVACALVSAEQADDSA